MAIPWGGIASAIGGIAGLFGSKKGAPSARENINKLAQGARQASERYGFNPLTLLGAGSTMGGGGGGGSAPPLASIDLIVGGLKDISDEVSGDAERRRKAEELELDLAKVQLEQARAGLIARSPVAGGVGQGPAPLGRRAAVQVGEAGRTPARKIGGFGTPTKGGNTIAPGRGQEIDPVVNSPGVFEIENVLTGGRPVIIPGEGEPWGIDELATAVVVGVPQVLGNIANEWVYGGKSYSERMKDYRDREKKELGKPKKATKVYDGPGGPVFTY